MTPEIDKLAEAATIIAESGTVCTIWKQLRKFVDLAKLSCFE